MEKLLNKEFIEILNNKEEKAHEFAEGNKHLENALLSLWDKGFVTSSSCKGHKTEETESYIIHWRPALSILYDTNFDKELSLLTSIPKDTVKELDLIVNYYGAAIVLRALKNRKNIFFDSFSNTSNKQDNNFKKIMKLQSNIRYSSKFKKDDLLNISIVYKNGNIESIRFHTNIKDIVNKIKEHYEVQEYEYDNKLYIAVIFDDFKFLNYICD